MGVRRTQYPALRLSEQSTGTASPALPADSPRLSAKALAASVFPYLRAGVVLSLATSSPTAQVEYVFPDLVWSSPGPFLVLSWNRVLIYPTPSPTPSVGEFYLYRTDGTDGPVEQRARLGRNPDDGDIIMAILYVVDLAA